MPTGDTDCSRGGAAHKRRARPVDTVQRTQYVRQTERNAYGLSLSLCASALHYRRLKHPRARSVVDRERTDIARRTGLPRPLVDKAAAYVQRKNPADACGHMLRRVQRMRGRLSGAVRRARPQTWDRDRQAVELLDAGASIRTVAARLHTAPANVQGARSRLARTMSAWDRKVRAQWRERQAEWRRRWRRFHRERERGRGCTTNYYPTGNQNGKGRGAVRPDPRGLFTVAQCPIRVAITASPRPRRAPTTRPGGYIRAGQRRGRLVTGGGRERPGRRCRTAPGSRRDIDRNGSGDEPRGYVRQRS